MSFAPRVSVVMPLYNKEGTVAESIRTVLRQSVTDLELIVVDDESTDAGPCIIRGLADPRIRLIHQEKGGVSKARNRGIQEARAEQVAFLDADDLWRSDFLETVLRLKEKFPSCGAWATDYHYLLIDGRTRPTIRRGVPPAPWEGILPDYFGMASESDPPLWTSAVSVAKRAIDAVGGFPVGLCVSEDLLTWARLAAHFDVAYSTVPKALYRLRHPMYQVMRDPDRDKEVGPLLESLIGLAEGNKQASMKRYVATWYRRRASVLLKTGRPTLAKREIGKVLHFQPPDLRVRIYTLLSSLPPFAAARLAKGLDIINLVRRGISTVP